jgi:TetR/AcrR family transcriptional repressor of nem operon
MRVSREQAIANREKVVDVASALFRKHGIDGVGVADIMKAAGLTHGGFYGHFDSKEDLAAEACSRAARRSWDVWINGASPGGLEAIVRKYLTPEHRNDRGRGCLYAAVGSDIPRQPRAVRRAFTERSAGYDRKTSESNARTIGSFASKARTGDDVRTRRGIDLVASGGRSTPIG